LRGVSAGADRAAITNQNSRRAQGPGTIPEILVEYRVVYDVLDDGLLPAWSGGEVGLFLLGLGGTLILGIGYYLERRSGGNLKRKYRVNWPALLVSGGLAVLGACLIYPLWREQAQCKEWARSDQYRITEGLITDSVVGRPSYFRVAGVRFRYYTVHGHEGGFRGEFTGANPPPGRLRDGQAVRIGSQDGRILRIEIKGDD